MTINILKFLGESPLLIMGTIIGAAMGGWIGAIISGFVGMVLDEFFQSRMRH